IADFNKWPIVLKRIEGTQGNFVEKAEDLKQAEGIMKKFWGKTEERSPIIAQEFISSPSYRVTLIGDKIVQTALKENKGWKSTGVYQKKFKKFAINKKLKNIIEKVKTLSGIKICGIDFLEKDGAPLLLEVNTTPGFDFFENEREGLIEQVIDFLKKST
ncbi:MAG: ATP-grasp domain-containing protein, partial [Nanoarchaeota archaeon]